MEIGERIKVLRKELSLTQVDFGDKIGLKQAVIGQMENNTRNITDRTIILICEKYNVREQWLRNGKGSIFVETDKTVISALADEYELDPLDQKIVECYLNLGAIQRKVIKSYLRSLIGAVSSDENYDDYREDYLKAKPHLGSDRVVETFFPNDDDQEKAALHAKLDEAITKEKMRKSQASSAKESDVG